MRMKKWMFGAVAASVMAFAGQAWAVPVSLELALLTDVSGSVDSNEYQLQKMGYVNAFRNSNVLDAILASEGGGIAVSYYEWSGTNQFATKVGWTLINSAATAAAFADALEATTRSYSGSTNPQYAINAVIPLFGL